MIKQTDIKKILLTPEKVITLLTMGIEANAIFYYCKTKVDQVEWEVIGPVQMEQYVEAEEDGGPNPPVIPAWTFEEIRIMIGASLTPGYVDVPFNYHPNTKGQEIRFCVNTPTALKPFNSGVEALGEALIKLIDGQVVDVEEANKRYDKVFKPL